MSIDLKKIDFAKGGGLVPAIVQDASTQQVLMLGYMNEAALAATIKNKKVTFFSRSRNELWCKGDTSGNHMDLVSISADCDNDTVLVLANPAGPACHTGTVSCFGKNGPSGIGILGALGRTIEARRASDPSQSYTAQLLSDPLTKPAQKLGEEAVETVIAALAESDEAFKNEAADLIYHLMVLLAAKDMSLDDIAAVLRARAD